MSGNSNSSSSDEVERTVRALMGEVSAMQPPPPPTAKPAKTAAKRRKSEGWSVKKDVPADSPTVSWCDGQTQYTVRNPANFGNILLKMQVFEGGRPTHCCGLYLDEVRDDEICMCLEDLVTRVEDMWVNRFTGAPRCSGVTTSASPLASWRKIAEASGERKPKAIEGGKPKASGGGKRSKMAGDRVTASKKRKA